MQPVSKPPSHRPSPISARCGGRMIIIETFEPSANPALPSERANAIDQDRHVMIVRGWLVVLCHKMRRAFFLKLLAQHGHLGSLLAIATIK
jgi:hypothetical protein